ATPVHTPPLHDALPICEAILSLLRGRTTYTLSRMARAQVYRNRSKGELELYQHGIAAVQEKMARAEQEFEAALHEINQRWAAVRSEEHTSELQSRENLV